MACDDAMFWFFWGAMNFCNNFMLPKRRFWKMEQTSRLCFIENPFKTQAQVLVRASKIFVWVHECCKMIQKIMETYDAFSVTILQGWVTKNTTPDVHLASWFCFVNPSWQYCDKENIRRSSMPLQRNCKDGFTKNRKQVCYHVLHTLSKQTLTLSHASYATLRI